MKEIILVKNGELALKGLNRSSFEDKLVKNIKHKISDLGDFEFTKSQSTIMVEPLDDDIDLYNPHLNVRDAYIRHVEQQNADLKTKINDLQDLLSQADRVILALLASLIVVAVIAVTLAV